MSSTLGTLYVNGAATNGTLIPGDYDYFIVSLLAGTAYTVSLEATGPDGLSDPFLYLTGEQTDDFLFDDDSGGNANALLNFTPTVSGDYYVVAAGASSYDAGSYALHVSAAAASDDHPDEQASTIVPGVAEKGMLETMVDTDLFVATLVGGQAYTVTLHGLDSGGGTLEDPLLYVYGEFDDVSLDFLLKLSDDDSGEGQDASLVFTPAFDGDYYLLASTFGTATGSYTLSIEEGDLGFSSDVDDGDSNAATLPLVQGSGNTTGAIDFGGDSDWYAVSFTAGVTYTISLIGQDGGGGTLPDPDFLGIFDADSNFLPATDNDDYGDSFDAQVTFTAPSTGTYYLAAGAYADAIGSYTLAVESSGLAAGETPADTSSTVSVTLGGAVAGVLESPGDVDWIAATLSAGQTYVFDLVGDRTAFNALSDPLILGLYDADGVFVPDTANDDFGFTRDAQITFTPDTDGVWYLAATGFDGDTGAYRVRLQSNAIGVDAAGETTATALPVVVDGGSLGGAIDFARDVDWYQVALTADQRYAITVRGADSGGGSLGDPELVSIYDDTGSVIPGTGSSGELDVRSFFTPVTTGNYYFAVSAAADETGSYTVAVSVDANGIQGDIADNLLTTAVATPGQAFTSTIDTAGDVDWVRVELTAGTSYRLDLQGAPTGNGTLSDPNLLGVFDERGMALANSADDDGGEGQDASALIVAPATGSFYVAMAGYGAATGTYSLLATALDAGNGGDAAAPQLLAVSPADNSQQVAPASNLTLVFDEPVFAGSGTVTITGGAEPLVLPINDPAIQFSGATVTIDPAMPLDDNTAYSVQISAGAIEDHAGNPFAGIADTTGFSFQTTSLAAVPAASWTVMVYMAADNNLEPFALADLNEMESVNFTGGLNVVTLVDRANGYATGDGNWTDTRVSLIGHDNNTNALSSFGAEDSIGEKNSGAGATLTEFINGAVAEHPASNYALIVWDHGGGLSGTSWDDASGGDNLKLAEFRSAVLGSNLPHFDFIGFDACLQGMLEQCWDVRDLTDVMVASQELEPGDGWEYQAFLGALAANPSMTSFDFATEVVAAYGDRYAGEADTTLAAVRTGALDGLNTALNDFAGTVAAAGPGVLPGLRTAAQHATRLGPSDLDYRDLGDFMQEIADTSGNSQVRTAASAVKAQLDDAVLAREGTVAGVNGLSIYLPLDSISFDYQSRELGFLQGSEWGSFLRLLLSDQRGDDLLGDDTDNRLSGYGGDDEMDGGVGDDWMDGGVGDDFLDGGEGADQMFGGAGSDVYVVDDAGDVCTETNDAANGGGIDEIRSFLEDFALGNFIENGVIEIATAARLRGNGLNNHLTGAGGANMLEGAGGNDTLDGAGGADTLDGGAGVDRMVGGNGSDTYRVDNTGDVAVETNGNVGTGGDDLVNSGVSYTLGANLERLTLTGGSAANGTGNGGNNGLTGNTGNNVLKGLAGTDTLGGGGGNDQLFGGLGNDVLTGGAGNDRFVFDTARGATNIDRITDFRSGVDKILLDDDIFTRLPGTTAGKPLAAGQYKFITSGTGFAAGDADDRIIYNTNTDKLYYDADGKGGAAAVQIALIPLAGTAHPVAGDFLLIA